MVSRGIAIAPAGEITTVAAHMTGDTGAGAPSAPPAPLQLAGPASYAVFQLHPGLPEASQQLEAAGYTAGGEAWHSLRLVVDGQVLAEATGSARLRAWWPMTLGVHAIWLEGEREAGGETLRSAAAQISVDPFAAQSVTMQTVD
jgi:hypothetical protein